MNDAGRRRTPFLFAVDFEMTEGIFLDDPAAQHELLFRVPAGSNIPKTKVPAERGTFEASPEPYEVYLSRFDVVMQGLQTRRFVSGEPDAPDTSRPVCSAAGGDSAQRCPLLPLCAGALRLFSPERSSA